MKKLHLTLIALATCTILHAQTKEELKTQIAAKKDSVTASKTVLPALTT